MNGFMVVLAVACFGVVLTSIILMIVEIADE